MGCRDGMMVQLIRPAADLYDGSFDMDQIKCNKCGHIGPAAEFRHGSDFFQKEYVAGCPKCDNRQSPGDASMRMFGGKRPFERVGDGPAIAVKDRTTALAETLRRADSAS